MTTPDEPPSTRRLRAAMAAVAAAFGVGKDPADRPRAGGGYRSTGRPAPRPEPTLAWLARAVRPIAEPLAAGESQWFRRSQGGAWERRRYGLIDGIPYPAEWWRKGERGGPNKYTVIEREDWSE